MIKISRRPIKIGTYTKVSRSLADNTTILNSIVKDAIKSMKYPKNTLRVVKRNVEMGYNFDDVVQDRLTLAVYMFVITFKR